MARETSPSRVPRGFLIRKVFIAGGGGREAWWWWAQNISTENLTAAGRKEVKVKAGATEGLP